MGAFISLPLTTILAVPLFSSYSTSFNLLFFTFNWYILLLSHPPLRVELFGLIGIRLLFFLLPALSFFAFDSAIPSLAVQIKEHGDLSVPTRRGRKKAAHVAAWSTFNVCLGVGLTIALELLSTKVLLWRSLLNLGKTLPFPWKAIQSIVGLLALRGLLQYVIHRFVLHNSRFFVSKLHKQWQHSIAAPYSLVAAYDHPLPYLLHHWVPLYVPAILFRTHFLPFLVVLAIASGEELLTYSGYTVLPSAIFVRGMARRVDSHFLVKGEGNYAAFGALDWITGTAVGGDVVEDLKAEWEKHDMDNKVAKGANDAGNLAENLGFKMKSAARKKSGKKL